MVNSIVLYGLVLLLSSFSFYKDKQKTQAAFAKAWKIFMNLLPDLLAILLFVGLSLSILSPAQISALLGQDAGFPGITLSLVIGAIALIPSFIVFPLGATLLENGAGLAQVSALMASLMAVGIMTIPLESRLFGKRFAYARNLSALMMCLFFSLLVLEVLG